MTIIISCLYFLHAANFAVGWSFIYYTFIQNGWNFFTVFIALQGHNAKLFKILLTEGILGGISTFLADISIVC